MNNFESFRTVYNLIIVTITSVLTVYLLSYYESKIKGKKLSTLFVVISVSILIVVLNYSVEKLIDNNASVRKWIDPDNFIEGYWYDITSDSTGVTHGVVMKISYENGNYLVTGETMNLSGEHYATFKSTSIVYSNRVLFFNFETYNSNNYLDQGIDQLQFGIPPDSYTGFYLNYHYPGGTKIFAVTGTKVKDEELKYYNNFKSIDDKKKFLYEKILKSERGLRPK
jgi:hypothetical protein